MKYKPALAVLYILFALPIPVSLVSWLGTILSVANFGMLDFHQPGVLAATVLAVSAMLSAGTYPATYFFSLLQTIKNKRLKFVSFLPLLHIVLSMTLILLWSSGEALMT